MYSILESNNFRDFSHTIAKEWLIGNGIGGYASSTISGCNTRRYHGLLVSAHNPPAGRSVLLSKIDEVLWIKDRDFHLSVNNFIDTVYPEGFRYQTRFSLSPFPEYVYVVDNFSVIKRILTQRGANTTVIEYVIKNPAGETFNLKLFPLVALRDYHHLIAEGAQFDIDTHDSMLSVYSPQYTLSLYLNYSTLSIAISPFWNRRLLYIREKERGLDYMEDLYCPCVFSLESSDENVSFTITASDTPDAAKTPSEIVREWASHLKSIPGYNKFDNPVLKRLISSSDTFIVSRGSGKTIIAGYHWFADWGRDTMIALPGLCLSTGRFEDAKKVLVTFAKHIWKGLIPNRFLEDGETCEYNTADGSLWFIIAVWHYVNATGNYNLVKDTLFPAMETIMLSYLRGTEYQIKADSDGLLSSGEANTQLTWMDAKVDGHVVTPRHGKAVEINALWYNALMIMDNLSEIFLAKKMNYAQLAAIVRKSFLAAFWYRDGGYLYDVVKKEYPGKKWERDASLRPNQIFAVSLPFSLLPLELEKRVLEIVRQKLLTPYGLRTLSPENGHYRGTYSGDTFSRDTSYHQGTVWPWLLGHFIDGSIKHMRGKDEKSEEITRLLSPLIESLDDAGIWHISEVFDGDKPHSPGGCIAQAWSAAEIIRILSRTY